MIATPAFRGNKSVRSWLPPSGKMPRHCPWPKPWWTALYIADWSTFGRTLYGTHAKEGGIDSEPSSSCKVHSVSETTSFTLYIFSSFANCSWVPEPMSFKNVVCTPLTRPSATDTVPTPLKAMSCALATGMHLNTRAQKPTNGRFQDFSAIMKHMSRWQLVSSMMPSTNWLLWLPVSMIGPFLGMFSAPTISTDLKKMLFRVDRKNSLAPQ
mmetsp:Transcript_60400/g.112132  ORF Transcript_60400/g.112132 Transcript_60400/m.112132 type:complete len:211 (+) Transcript_60400:1299-1931(+)